MAFVSSDDVSSFAILLAPDSTSNTAQEASNRIFLIFPAQITFAVASSLWFRVPVANENAK